ncbi:MAG: redoxin domain-containing protein [Planctomycetes bacterium]|nr:redoxin domain-containing protein [Planctomycetota bacterium]
MKELAVANSAYPDIQKLGGEVVAVTPDQPDALKRVADKLGLNYPVLADPEFQAIDAYELRHKDAVPGQDSARPAMFFIRADGTVADSHQTDNYRFALSTDEILERFKKIAVTSP